MLRTIRRIVAYHQGMTLPMPQDAPFEDRFANALRSRGLELDVVYDAVFEAVGAVSTTGLTEAEVTFAAGAGVPPEVLTGDGDELIIESALLTAHDSIRRAAKLSTNQVASRLQRDPANVRRMLRNGDLYAAGQIDRQTAYPAWQFTDDGVLPHLRQAIAALPSGYHARDIETVMTSPMEELNGNSPREWLEADGAIEPLLSLLDELSLS